jgi:hypothetical protein
MKCISVYAYQIALITKRGKLTRVLTEGKHWIGFGCQVTLYDMTVPLHISSRELTLLHNSDLLKNYLDVIDIGDNEIGIEERDGKFSRILQTGKIVYWKSPIVYTIEIIDTSAIEVHPSIPKYILMKPEVLRHLRVFPVESYQKAVLYIDGKYIKALEPGIYRYWKTEQLAVVKTIDMRLQNLEVSGQELLTKDKAGIRINFSTQYKVVDVHKALVDTKDYEKQLYTLLQLGLRAYIGSLTLDGLLADKESIGSYIIKQLESSADILGVEITSAGIKDVILPGDVKAIMNQVLIAQKKAQANTIMRQEETASTRSLLNTAKLMEQNNMLFKLKEMEYVEKISAKIGEITVNGGTGVIDQLKQIVIAK